MVRPIVVINPNSTESVTQGMRDAVLPLGFAGGPEIECVTMTDGPPGVETQADVESVVAPLCELVGKRNEAAGAFVIGCYSDPGLYAVREVTDRPVLGIAESAMLTALTRGDRFGVISILAQSVPRHMRYMRSLGLDSRFSADLPIGLGVTELSDDAVAFDRLVAVGRDLRDRHFSDVVILGCTGMARFQSQLEDALDIAVVEPTRAAVTMAIGAATFH